MKTQPWLSPAHGFHDEGHAIHRGVTEIRIQDRDKKNPKNCEIVYEPVFPKNLIER